MLLPAGDTMIITTVQTVTEW